MIFSIYDRFLETLSHDKSRSICDIHFQNITQRLLHCLAHSQKSVLANIIRISVIAIVIDNIFILILFIYNFYNYAKLLSVITINSSFCSPKCVTLITYFLLRFQRVDLGSATII